MCNHDDYHYWLKILKNVPYIINNNYNIIFLVTYNIILPGNQHSNVCYYNITYCELF